MERNNWVVVLTITVIVIGGLALFFSRESAIAFVIGLTLIVYGLLKLRGTTLLKRGRYPDPLEDSTIDVRDVRIDIPTIKQIRDEFEKEDSQ